MDQVVAAKKSVFNAKPLLYKSVEEIQDADELNDTLKTKFTISFTEFKKLGIKDVLQGDLMFTNDVETKDIDGATFRNWRRGRYTAIYEVNGFKKVAWIIKTRSGYWTYNVSYFDKEKSSASLSCFN